MLKILESNLRMAEAEGDLRAAERIRRNIEFLKSHAKPQNDNSDCTNQKA